MHEDTTVSTPLPSVLRTFSCAMSHSPSNEKENIPEVDEFPQSNQITRYLTRLQQSQLRACVGKSQQEVQNGDATLKVSSSNANAIVPFEMVDILDKQLNHSPTQRKKNLRLPKHNEENKKLKAATVNETGRTTYICRAPLQTVSNNLSRKIYLNMGGGDVVQTQRASIEEVMQKFRANITRKEVGVDEQDVSFENEPMIPISNRDAVSPMLCQKWSNLDASKYDITVPACQEHLKEYDDGPIMLILMEQLSKRSHSVTQPMEFDALLLDFARVHMSVRMLLNKRNELLDVVVDEILDAEPT